jgi:hypothetical protein
MTTVINYNVLNFFMMRLNNIALNDDVRAYDRHLDDRRSTYPWEQDEIGDVIDVTPYSRTTVDDQAGGIRAKRTGKNIDFAGSSKSKIELLYDRQGRPVQIVQAKGLFVDTYV